jgi:hypothetical protein
MTRDEANHRARPLELVLAEFRAAGDRLLARAGSALKEISIEPSAMV